ncbi:MAG: response regulator [Bdellovibrionota bacterium]
MERCKKILVVEDNEDVRESIVDVLSTEGYDVETARNGKEALLKLETMDDATLVLLDLMMPVMNGWEFIDAHKKDRRFKNHRIVTISAVNPTQSIEDPTPLDVQGSISKPLSLEGIWAEVRKHCDVASPSTLAVV